MKRGRRLLRMSKQRKWKTIKRKKAAFYTVRPMKLIGRRKLLALKKNSDNST